MNQFIFQPLLAHSKLTIITIRGTFIITVFTQLKIAKCLINTSHFIELSSTLSIVLIERKLVNL